MIAKSQNFFKKFTSSDEFLRRNPTADDIENITRITNSMII